MQKSFLMLWHHHGFHSIQLIYTHDGYLSHWGRDKMENVSQTIFPNVFSSINVIEFWLTFHWSVFLKPQLTIFQHWFRWWLGAVQAAGHYMNQWWLFFPYAYMHHSASMSSRQAQDNHDVTFDHIYIYIVTMKQVWSSPKQYGQINDTKSFIYNNITTKNKVICIPVSHFIHGKAKLCYRYMHSLKHIRNMRVVFLNTSIYIMLLIFLQHKEDVLFM